MADRSVLVLLFATVGCLRVAEERARRDLDVGSAEAAGVELRVKEGLAAVQSARPGQFVLWCQAPILEISLAMQPSAATEWELVARNCLANAELTVLEGSLSMSPLPAERPAERRWRLTLTAPQVRVRLAPADAATSEAWSFAVLSDVQDAIDRVQDIVALINAQPDVRFVLGAGDLTDRGRTDELVRFQTELATLAVPYFATLGNHELGTEPLRWHEYFGRGSFHFDFRGVHFTLLDSASATLDPLVYDQLDGWLHHGRHDTHIVAMHIPPVDPTGVRNGSFASRDEAAHLLGTLARAGVDLTLYGHIHSHRRFKNAGIPAHISGGGGAIPERFDGIGRHFLVVELGASGVRQVRVVRVDP